MAQEEKTGHTAGPLEINPWQPEDGHTLVCGGIGQSYGLVAEFLTKADAVEAVHRWNAVPALVEAQAHHLDLLGAMLVMMEDAIDGEIVQDGRRYERGVSDMEISPDGRLTIADVRAALLSAKGESQ